MPPFQKCDRLVGEDCWESGRPDAVSSCLGLSWRLDNEQVICLQSWPNLPSFMQTKKWHSWSSEIQTRAFYVHFSLLGCLLDLFVNSVKDGRSRLVWSGGHPTCLPQTGSPLGATSSSSLNEADTDKIEYVPSKTTSLQSTNELGHLDNNAFAIPRSLMCCEAKEHVIWIHAQLV